jgi:DNA-binding XRE family transcriptional regulator
VTGQEFRKWRREREITQQVVADYCDINKSTICRWEKDLINLRECIYLRVMEYVSKTN